MPYKLFWPSADTYIRSAAATTNYSTETTFQIHDNGAQQEHGLLEFDISAIPSNATVTSAILTLTSGASDSGSFTHNINPLVRNWVEAEATWNVAETGTNWGTAGANNTTTDYDNTTTVQISHPGTQGNQATADITSFVQDWVDGTAANEGLRIEPDAPAASDREWASKENNNKSWWPFLEVYWTVPAIAYAINGTTISAGINAVWPPMQTGQNADGTPQLSNWFPHRWETASMEMSVWETIWPLRGTSLTSVVTTNQDTPNVAATYSTARLMSMTGSQRGRLMENVVINFMIDETS